MRPDSHIARVHSRDPSILDLSQCHIRTDVSKTFLSHRIRGGSDSCPVFAPW